MRYEAAERAQQQARRTRYMRGWDAAIAGQGANPYNRADYRRDWHRGHSACLEGQSLPHWYEEWSQMKRSA